MNDAEQQENKYTLDEARLELQRRECAMYGHNFDVICSGDGNPVSIRCACGLSWSVKRDEEDV